MGWYRRSYQAQLLPSDEDIPLSASQLRQHVRQGLLFNLTHTYKGHTLQAGADVQRVTPREFFSFFVTDDDEAAESGLSSLALQFTKEVPFLFQDRAVRGQASVYVQDTFSPFENLTLNAGVRFDHSSVMVSENQISPRVGAVYYIPWTRSAIRGSFNRLFMPPQVENLLLSSSEQARRLSPFVTPEGQGGAQVRHERQSAFEIGWAQDIGNLFKLDVAQWWRLVRNYRDPNIFFSANLFFPNTVAEGKAYGLDVRIDIPEKRGWSGYLSYSNSPVYQVGPINGGLFLEDDVIEIGPGTRFTPDHDQRNVGAAGLTYYHRKTGLWAAVHGRHESGTPLEVDDEALSDLMERRGAELVDVDRRRVKPRTLFDLSAGADLFRDDRVTIRVQFDAQNVGDARFAYNFGNPFSGTHFGHPRMFSARLKLLFQ